MNPKRHARAWGRRDPGKPPRPSRTRPDAMAWTLDSPPHAKSVSQTFISSVPTGGCGGRNYARDPPVRPALSPNCPSRPAPKLENASSLSRSFHTPSPPTQSLSPEWFRSANQRVTPLSITTPIPRENQNRLTKSTRNPRPPPPSSKFLPVRFHPPPAPPPSVFKASRSPKLLSQSHRPTTTTTIFIVIVRLGRVS